MVETYVALDLETTGLNAKNDKIIEIGAAKIYKGEIIDTYATFVNPGRILSETVKRLTGIRQEQVNSAPELKQVIPTLLGFIGDLPLLGHSILFDYSFVKRAAVNQSLSFEKEGIDTLKIARRYLADLESRNLGYLCRHYGISHSAHRALEDAIAAHQLYQRLCVQFYKKETSERAEFKASPLIYCVKKEGVVTNHQKEKLYQLVEKHKLVIEFEIEKLTRNEASRYTDKILAKYGR